MAHLNVIYPLPVYNSTIEMITIIFDDIKSLIHYNIILYSHVPVLQVLPVQPGRQSQWNCLGTSIGGWANDPGNMEPPGPGPLIPPTASTVRHLPWLAQGSVAHGFSTTSQLAPPNPSGHVHVYRSGAVLLHVPPFRHGSWVPQ